MKLLKILFLLVLSINAFSQNEFENKFREMYPYLGDFEDLVHVKSNDTCLLLFDLLVEPPDYINSNEALQIESNRYGILRTTIEEIKNGKTNELMRIKYLLLT